MAGRDKDNYEWMSPFLNLFSSALHLQRAKLLERAQRLAKANMTEINRVIMGEIASFRPLGTDLEFSMVNGTLTATQDGSGFQVWLCVSCDGRAVYGNVWCTECNPKQETNTMPTPDASFKIPQKPATKPAIPAKKEPVVKFRQAQLTNNQSSKPLGAGTSTSAKQNNHAPSKPGTIASSSKIPNPASSKPGTIASSSKIPNPAPAKPGTSAAAASKLAAKKTAQKPAEPGPSTSIVYVDLDDDEELPEMHANVDEQKRIDELALQTALIESTKTAVAEKKARRGKKAYDSSSDDDDDFVGIPAPKIPPVITPRPQPVKGKSKKKQPDETKGNTLSTAATSTAPTTAKPAPGKAPKASRLTRQTTKKANPKSLTKQKDVPPSSGSPATKRKSDQRTGLSQAVEDLMTEPAAQDQQKKAKLIDDGFDDEEDILFKDISSRGSVEKKETTNEELPATGNKEDDPKGKDGKKEVGHKKGKADDKEDDASTANGEDEFLMKDDDMDDSINKEETMELAVDETFQENDEDDDDFFWNL